MKKRTLLAASVVLGLLALGGAGLGGWTSSAAGADADPEPVGAARFAISIDGVEIGSFSELALRSGFEPSELALGTKGVTLPGKSTPPTVTLKRGHTSSMEMWAWHEAARAGALSARKSANLVGYDTAGTPVARYHLEAAWPAKVEIGGLKAGASQVLMETVTLVADSIHRVSP